MKGRFEGVRGKACGELFRECLGIAGEGAGGGGRANRDVVGMPVGAVGAKVVKTSGRNARTIRVMWPGGCTGLTSVSLAWA